MCPLLGSTEIRQGCRGRKEEAGRGQDTKPAMILLDTQILAYAIRHLPIEVFQQLDKVRVGELGISVISAFGLEVGALRAPGGKCGERRGEKIGPYDMPIAAQALSLGATLVTNNEREFRRVKGLRVENWVP